MRILFITRLFNRGGFYTLKHLIENTRYEPLAIIVPYPNKYQCDADREIIKKAKKKYIEECSRLGSPKLKFFKSSKLLADDHGIPVNQLSDINTNEVFQRLSKLDLDLIVVGGGWHQKIDLRILNLPTYGAINLHPSLLPKFRGTDVHRWQIYHDVDFSGVTAHYMTKDFDAGPIIKQDKVYISPEDSPQILASKVGKISGNLLENVLDNIELKKPNKNKITSDLSDKNPHLYHKWPWNDLGFLKLDFDKTARELSCFIRACTQESYKFNGPWMEFDNELYIVRKAFFLNPEKKNDEVGNIVHHDLYSLIISCKKGFLAIQKLQKTTLKQLQNANNRFKAVTPANL